MITGSGLIQPQQLWSRAEVLARPCPIPQRGGVYAWYFRRIPPDVPIDDCITLAGLTLLYAGIAPNAPSTTSTAANASTLARRIRTHYRGNASRSTLRLTLGCLLRDELAIKLSATRSGRLTFGAGEAILSQWMAEHALVTWIEHPQPWVLERELIASLSLPLNLDQNQRHPFHAELSRRRREARAQGRSRMLNPIKQ